MKTHADTIYPLPGRLETELKTIEAMIGIYCRAHHKPKHSPCPDCSHLLHYAAKRLRHCPFGQVKPTCGNCRVHCYKKDMRATIQTVMRYAGPRMAVRHPLMALRHILDSRRTAPESPRKPANTGTPTRRPGGHQ